MPWVKKRTSHRNTISAAAKATILETFGNFVRQHYKANLKSQPASPQFNRVVDYSTRWHGPYLYLRAHYECPPGAQLSSFEIDFVRLGVRTGERFNLWARRHNDEWICPCEELTLAECLTELRTNPWFEPR